MDEPVPHIEVTVTESDAEHAQIRLTGELTEHARKPLIRTMADLLLSAPQLRRVQLDLGEVTFLNSDGVATLVQVQKMCQPRGIELALVVRGAAVSRPLQLSGLWTRFTIVDRRDETAHEATPKRTDPS
jgi:stage II sporulation protein AA (anti-sigma F factor antagonist)